MENASYQNLTQKAEITLIFRNVWIVEQSGMSGWRSKSGVVDEEVGFTGKSLQCLCTSILCNWLISATVELTDG